MFHPQKSTFWSSASKHILPLFQGRYHEKVHGTAIGSPISPLIANLFMEKLEDKTITVLPLPHLWLRYVDDTFIIQQAEHSHQLLKHINSQDPHIQFTTEDPNQDNT